MLRFEAESKYFQNSRMETNGQNWQTPRTHGADASPAPTVYSPSGGATIERHPSCVLAQPRRGHLDKPVGEVVLSGGAYLWWAQELAPEQRSSGSPPRGPAYRSGIDERSAAGVAPNAAEHSWRQSLELGVDLLSPAAKV